MKFYLLAVGARFVFRGRAFVKVAMSLAVLADDQQAEGQQADGYQLGWGIMFLGETEVVSDGPLLPADVAAEWKPSDVPWTDYLTPAPAALAEGQRQGGKSEIRNRKSEM